MVLWFFYSLFWGEHVWAGGGLGWDGARYGEIAATLLTKLHGREIDQYAFCRILASVVVFGFNSLFRISPTTPNLIRSFLFYDVCLIGIQAYLWWKLVERWKWSAPVRWVSFSSLFLNYAVLKMIPYYPVLTDTTSMFLGFLLFYFFAIGNRWGVFATTLLGAFSLQTVFLSGLVLLVLPEQGLKTRPSTREPIDDLLQFGPLLASLYFYYGSVRQVALYLYLCLGANPFADYRYYLKALTGLFDRKMARRIAEGALLAVVAVVILKVTRHTFASDDPGPPQIQNPVGFLKFIASWAIKEPAIGLVANFVYFGPLVPLLVYFWRDVIAEVKRHGLGLTIVVALFFTLSIHSESRNNINAWPMLALLGCNVLSRYRIGWPFAYAFTAMSLVVSKFWLPINNHGEFVGTYVDWPDQWYYMSHGPWMQPLMYRINAAALIATAVLLGIAWRGVQSKTTSRTSHTSSGVA